jgi:hypothetical protein
MLPLRGRQQRRRPRRAVSCAVSLALSCPMPQHIFFLPLPFYQSLAAQPLSRHFIPLTFPLFYNPTGMEKLQPYLMPVMIMLVVRSFLGDGAGKKEEGGGAEKAEAAKKAIKAAK